jgi:hypothetical protein
MLVKLSKLIHKLMRFSTYLLYFANAKPYKCLFSVILLILLFSNIRSLNLNYKDSMIIKNEECVAKEESCICTSKPKQTLIEELLEKDNKTPDNIKILNEIFTDSEYLIEQDDFIDQDESLVSNETLPQTFKSLLFMIKCANHSLKKLPKFKEIGYSKQPYINCLDFKFNHIDYISDSQLYGLLVKCIDLSHNKLFKISRNAFSGLLNLLLVIKLNNNQLHSNNSLPIYFASKLALLQALFMSSNKLDIIYARSFTGVFSPNLRILDLSSNVINCINDHAFAGLVSLKYLNLCNNLIGVKYEYSDCSLSTNKLGFLKSLDSLEHLKLCNNKFETIITGRSAFKNSKRLKHLDLSDNKFENLHGLFCPISQPIEMSSTLNDTSYLKELNILNLARNELGAISINDLNCMESLEEVYLQDNRISYIDLHSFKNLVNLKVLYLNNNPRLIPYPSMFTGLENSLMHLKFNFDQQYKTNYDFETVVEIILLKNNLFNLEELDLSGSNFEIVHLNLAHYLLTPVKLNSVKCSSCSIKYLKFKYELLTGENRIYSAQIEDEIHSEKLFYDRYIQYVCPKKLLGKKLNFTLDHNLISECQTNKVLIKDEIDFGLNGNNITTNDCSAKWVYFIKALMNNVIVKNYNCIDSTTKHSMNWQSYNMKKFKNFIKKQNCSLYNTIGKQCTNYYHIDNNRNIVSKLNSCNFLFRSNSFTLIATNLFIFLLFDINYF